MSSSYSENFWRETQDALAHWQGLSPSERHALFARAESPHFRSASVPRITPELSRVIGLVRRAQGWGNRLGQDTGQPQIEAALKSLTTHEERRLFAAKTFAKPEVLFEEILMKVESGTWGSAFMQAASLGHLPTAVRDWIAKQETTYGDSDHRLLQTMTGVVREKGNPLLDRGFSIAADDLMAWVSARDSRKWADLMFWAVRLALLIPYADEGLGLRFFLPEPGKKKSASDEVQFIRVDETDHPGRIAYHATPFLIDAVDALLHALKLEPAPLLTDGFNAPMAYLRKMGKRLKLLGYVGSPGGLPEEYGFLPEMRAGLAWHFLAESKFFESKGRSWKNQKAEITPAGMKWSALSKEAKWKRLLHDLPFGPSKPRKINPTFECLGGFSMMPLPYDSVTAFVWQSMEEATKKIGAGIVFEPWLQSLVGPANPFTIEASRTPQLAYAWKRWQESPATGFRKMLMHYLAALASIGAVGFGHAGNGKLCMKLTSVGHYVFGLSDDLRLEVEWPRVALVGPDFTITLMEAAPMVAEALDEFSDLAKVGEKGGATAAARTKSGLTTHADAGATFKISRESIQRAATKGLTFETVQELLTAVAKNDLPPQVMKQVAEWFQKRSLIRCREGILIEGDDPLVIAELKSRFAKDFEMLSATALLYTGKSKRSALLEKLSKAGYHLG